MSANGHAYTGLMCWVVIRVLHVAEGCIVFMLGVFWKSCRVIRLSKHVVNMIVKVLFFSDAQITG